LEPLPDQLSLQPPGGVERRRPAGLETGDLGREPLPLGPEAAQLGEGDLLLPGEARQLVLRPPPPRLQRLALIAHAPQALVGPLDSLLELSDLAELRRRPLRLALLGLELGLTGSQSGHLLLGDPLAQRDLGRGGPGARPLGGGAQLVQLVLDRAAARAEPGIGQLQRGDAVGERRLARAGDGDDELLLARAGVEEGEGPVEGLRLGAVDGERVGVLERRVAAGSEALEVVGAEGDGGALVAADPSQLDRLQLGVDAGDLEALAVRDPASVDARQHPVADRELARTDPDRLFPDPALGHQQLTGGRVQLLNVAVAARDHHRVGAARVGAVPVEHGGATRLVDRVGDVNSPHGPQ
jgi:hypothetical protein